MMLRVSQFSRLQRWKNHLTKTVIAFSFAYVVVRANPHPTPHVKYKHSKNPLYLAYVIYEPFCVCFVFFLCRHIRPPSGKNAVEMKMLCRVCFAFKPSCVCLEWFRTKKSLPFRCLLVVITDFLKFIFYCYL